MHSVPDELRGRDGKVLDLLLIRRLGPLATGATVCALFASAAWAKEPQSLRDLPAGTTFAADDRGRVLTHEPGENRLIVWGPTGQRESSCQLDIPGASPGNRASVALSGGTILVSVFTPDGTRLLAVEPSKCRVTTSREMDGIVMASSPSRDGWVLRLMDVETGAPRFIQIDFRLRTSSTYDVVEDIESLRQHEPEESATPETRRQPRALTALGVSGEMWVIPGDRYAFVRPRQKGKDARSFEPPACLRTKGRSLSRDEVRAEAVELARKFEKDPQLGPLFRQRAEAPNPGEVYSPAVARVAVNRHWAGVTVRDESGCRLDVWDMDLEAPVALTRIGSSCPGFFTFDDERALVLDERGVREIPFAKPLDLALQKPCDEAAAPGSKAKPAIEPGRPVSVTEASDAAAHAN